MCPEGNKRCLVAVDAPTGPLLCALVLPPDATVAAALQEARLRLDECRADPTIDWEGWAVGIWGLRCGRSDVPKEGDRIELYRPLAADPRQRRRQRVRKGRGS